MKKIFLTVFAAVLALGLRAQDSDVTGKVQMAVYIPEDCESVPVSAQKMLIQRINSMLAKNGMATTNDYSPFFITADALLVEKNVLPGAPTKYQQKLDVTLTVINALEGKVFGSVDVPTHAVANSEQKAYIACFGQIPTATPELKSFFRKTTDNIIKYFDAKADELISKAKVLARGKSYQEALFVLACIPEACKCYPAVVEVGIDIYNQYIDMESFEYLAKARAIWNAGQDAAAAAEAGQYIALINPNSSCYSDAVALNNEIKARVKSDIDYYRKQDELDRSREHQQKMSEISAWREVGVAYGNNQKSNQYHNIYSVR